MFVCFFNAHIILPESPRTWPTQNRYPPCTTDREGKCQFKRGSKGPIFRSYVRDRFLACWLTRSPGSCQCCVGSEPEGDNNANAAADHHHSQSRPQLLKTAIGAQSARHEKWNDRKRNHPLCGFLSGDPWVHSSLPTEHQQANVGVLDFSLGP